MAITTKQQRGSLIGVSLPFRPWLSDPASDLDRLSLLKFADSSLHPIADITPLREIDVKLTWEIEDSGPRMTISAGEDAVLNFTLDPVPDDAIDDWTFEFSLLPSPYDPIEDPAVVLETTDGFSITDGDAGTFSLSLPAASTAIATGLYQYELWRTNSGAVTMLGTGLFRVLGR